MWGPWGRVIACRSLVLVVTALGAAGMAAAPSLGDLRTVLHPTGGRLDASNTFQGVHLGLAFDYEAHNASSIASNVGYVFGGYFLDWNPHIRARVPKIDADLPFDTDAYPQSIPGHSLAAWKAKHPDWIVYRCDRTTPACYGSGNT